VDTEMPFEPGDVLLMYTDAVTEAEAADDTCFGLASLKELLRAARGGSIEAFIERLRRDLAHHSGRADLEDDLTILAVEAISEAGETTDATREDGTS
jgi:sigma-B regulation protein RsbU (phosphoserine phosphatase)